MTKQTSMLALLAVSLASACGTESNTDAMFRSAVEETVGESKAHAHRTAFMHIVRGIDLQGDAATIANNVSLAIEAHAPCAQISRTDDGLAVSLPDDGTCADDLSGSVTVAITAGAEPRLDYTFALFGSHDVQIDGAAQLMLQDDIRLGESTVELSRGEADRTMTSIWTETPVEGGYQLNGTRTVESCMGAREKTLTELVFRAGDSVPSAGETVAAGPGGGTITTSFERVDDDTVWVTIQAVPGDGHDDVRAAMAACRELHGGGTEAGDRAKHRRGRRGLRRRRHRFEGERTFAVSPDGTFIEPVQ